MHIIILWILLHQPGLVNWQCVVVDVCATPVGIYCMDIVYSMDIVVSTRSCELAVRGC